MSSPAIPGECLLDLFAADGGVPAIFSSKVADYLASRPGYPGALFDTLDSFCGLRPGALVADVGAGTGLLSLGLLQRGWRVVGVEPSAEMRSAAEHLLGRERAWRSVQGSAEAMPLDDASADLVAAAQAFHWFDIDAARAECLRVLKPHGQVALIWNDRVQGDALHAALDEVFAAFGGAKRAAMLAQAERAGVTRFFGAATPQQWTWPLEHRLDAAALASLVFSRSYMPARNSPEGQEARRLVQRLFESSATDGGVAVRYRTVAIIGRPA
ncbi:MAG: class I SAM-dependent methyltransferase [Burkholderiaceae bacterium]